jgi:hypothetical protein
MYQEAAKSAVQALLIGSMVESESGEAPVPVPAWTQMQLQQLCHRAELLFQFQQKYQGTSLCFVSSLFLNVKNFDFVLVNNFRSGSDILRS